MDKKKLLTASLASVAVLGLALAISQPLVVKAEEETTAQNKFLANYDKALEEAVKALEVAKTNSPEEVKAKADTIASLKAAAQTRAAIVEGFKKGLTAKQAEVFIDELNKKQQKKTKKQQINQLKKQLKLNHQMDKMLLLMKFQNLTCLH